jgi:hypothetical protein
MHIYAFGSVCRGEFDRASDVDMLACVDVNDGGIDTGKYSVYEYERLRQLWLRGSPFAWHLHLESKLIFASDGADFIQDIGMPSAYSEFSIDYVKFRRLFEISLCSARANRDSFVFDLSCMFLSIRNMATCYSLVECVPEFSRYSPFRIDPALPLGDEEFSVLMRSRLLSTRGIGPGISAEELHAVLDRADDVVGWMGILARRGGCE